MNSPTFTIRPVAAQDGDWVLSLVREWGADFIVSRGLKIFPTRLPGFCAIGSEGERLGLVTYEISARECQMVTLHALRLHGGIGTALTAAVRDAAVSAGCRRLWLITTNDNLDALRFYQRRGFELVVVHRDFREVARRLKPSIPLIGNYGIPIQDEIELELGLDTP
jgi:N-acetylglutamate synthase-like GNAT family acetyltransferase